MLHSEIEDELLRRQGSDHRTLLRQSGVSSYASAPSVAFAEQEEEELRRVMQLSLEDTQKPCTDDAFDHELEQVLLLSQREAGPPTDDEILHQVIAASRTEHEARGSDSRGDFITLASMGQRAKQARLERGQNIDDLSTDGNLRTKQYTADDDLALPSSSTSARVAPPQPSPSSVHTHVAPSVGAAAARPTTSPATPRPAANPSRPLPSTSTSTPVCPSSGAVTRPLATSNYPASTRATVTSSSAQRLPSPFTATTPGPGSSHPRLPSHTVSTPSQVPHASSSQTQASSSTPRPNVKSKSKSKPRNHGKQKEKPKRTSSLPVPLITEPTFTPSDTHPEYNKWAASIDDAMNVQLAHAASGPSPAYAHTAQKGEKTAEFDAEDDFVWQKSGWDMDDD